MLSGRSIIILAHSVGAQKGGKEGIFEFTAIIRAKMMRVLRHLRRHDNSGFHRMLSNSPLAHIIDAFFLKPQLFRIPKQHQGQPFDHFDGSCPLRGRRKPFC